MFTGHGHVFPRAAGVRARCGGPGICPECSRDAARAAAADAARFTPPPAPGPHALDSVAHVAALRAEVEQLRSQLKGEDALHNEIEGTRALLVRTRADLAVAVALLRRAREFIFHKPDPNCTKPDCRLCRLAKVGADIDAFIAARDGGGA